MSIKSNIRREKDNEAKVVLKNLRISPQKLNLVLGMIRRQKADVAISAYCLLIIPRTKFNF